MSALDLFSVLTPAPIGGGSRAPAADAGPQDPQSGAFAGLLALVRPESGSASVRPQNGAPFREGARAPVSDEVELGEQAEQAGRVGQAEQTGQANAPAPAAPVQADAFRFAAADTPSAQVEPDAAETADGIPVDASHAPLAPMDPETPPASATPVVAAPLAAAQPQGTAASQAFAPARAAELTPPAAVPGDGQKGPERGGAGLTPPPTVPEGGQAGPAPEATDSGMDAPQRNPARVADDQGAPRPSALAQVQAQAQTALQNGEAGRLVQAHRTAEKGAVPADAPPPPSKTADTAQAEDGAAAPARSSSGASAPPAALAGAERPGGERPIPQPELNGGGRQTPDAARSAPDEAASAPLRAEAVPSGASAGAPGGLPARATLETTALMAAQIVRRLEGRATRFDMALTPEGLGRVDVRMEIDRDGNLAARLVFDNPAAAAELRGRVDDLRRQLEASGFQIGDDALEFTEREGRRDPPPDRRFADSDSGRAFAGAGRLIEDAPLSPPPARWAALTLAPEGVDMKV